MTVIKVSKDKQNWEVALKIFNELVIPILQTSLHIVLFFCKVLFMYKITEILPCIEILATTHQNN